MTRLTRGGQGAVALLAAGALALTACGSSSKSSPSGGGSSGGGSSAGGGGANKASAPGVTATSVTIGSHQPLTGVAAPGYSEIAPASKAYFDYVNDQGGVNGRKINYLFKDDAYNPSQTSSVVKQLVLQSHVYAVFEGLGTPTHSAVVDYLNANKIPDLFVASGCQCWDEPGKHPQTFGFQTDYVVEGKVLGAYIKKNFAGKKIGYLYQDDDFGQGGVKGLDMEVDKSQVVSRQKYVPTNIDIGPQVAALKAAGAQVVVSFTVPAFTALERLAELKLGFTPQLVVSNVGADPITLTGLLKSFSKGAAGGSLINGIVSDTYLPTLGDTSNSWIALFKKVHDKYDAAAPFDGNVEFGMSAAAVFVKALKDAGQNPSRSDLVKAVEANDLQGPGLTPFRFSKDSHAGYTGVQVGTITNGVIKVTGKPQVTDDGSGSITDFTGTQPTAPANGVG